MGQQDLLPQAQPGADENQGKTGAERWSTRPRAQSCVDPILGQAVPGSRVGDVSQNPKMPAPSAWVTTTCVRGHDHPRSGKHGLQGQLFGQWVVG